MEAHMHRRPKGSYSSSDSGVALLLALLMLVLLAAVGAAILYLSSGESSLVGNQRASSSAYWAAKGGLEEARARLSGGDPSHLASIPTDKNHITYIINPASGETVAPATSGNAYFDTEYPTEWGQPITTAGLTITTVNSDMQSLLAPLGTTLPYKWVRLTVKTEWSAIEDVNQDSVFDQTIPISYDPAANRQVLVANPPQNTIIYRATALSVLPNGTSAMMQYDLKPGNPVPPLPGALTLCGTGGVTIGQWPTSAGWTVTGNDTAAPPLPPLPGVADCDPTAQNQLDPGSWKYTTTASGAGGSPSVVNTSATMAACLQSYSCLKNLAASITASADATNPSCSNIGTATAPQISVFTSDPNCAGGTNGYGVLLATGNLTFKGNATFNGIVLVLGTGTFQANGTCCFNGGVFVANTSGPGPSLGTPSFTIKGGGNCGIAYNSVDVNLAHNTFSYRVAAARGINQ
jgi:hypothetical protein